MVLHRYLERETIARKIEFPNPPPAVIFLIPLLPKSQAKNWDLVGSQLEQTLGSLLSQDHDSWIAIVVGHNLPPVGTLPKDSRVVFRKAVFPKPRSASEGTGDKHRKWRLAASVVRAHTTAGSWFFALDADDLAHKTLVRSLAKLANPANGDGVIIEEGYVYDAGGRQIWACHNNFNQLFGSSFGVWLAPRELPENSDEKLSRFSQLFCGPHSKVQDRVVFWGGKVHTFRFPLIVYLINHQHSLMSRWSPPRGKNRVEGLKRLTPKERTRVLEEFE